MTNIFKNLINNLGYILLIAFIISNLPVFKRITQKDEFKKVDHIVLSLFFGIFGIIGTYSGTDVNGAIANTRIIGIMTGGILCGHYVGIISGIIAGVHRLFYDEGKITAVPCAIATMLTGFVSAYIYKNVRSKKWFYGLVGGIFMESVEMLLILLISKPYSKALSIVKSIYFPMSLTNSLGICMLILLIQRTFNEKELIAAKQAEIALEIANKTLPYFRKIDNDSLNKICCIIKESTKAAAVAITDRHMILAHEGLGSEHHKCNEPIQTSSTKQVIEDGVMRILNSPEEIKCSFKNCPLKSAIIVPLMEGDEVTGTLKLYYDKEKGISYTNEKLAIGLSHLISTQLEISKVGKLKELAAKSEIKALQAQINPHFLFNSLNTIVSFLRSDPNGARQLIVNLSTYLRYNIEEIGTFVDIHKELEQVKAYVEIEKARFGDKLNVIYDIDENIHIKIPSLIIQPLVENSIRHGILKGSGSGNVKIGVKKLNIQEVMVTVEDDGIGIPQTIIDSIYSDTMEENKIGISNVNRRLKYIYGSGLTIERLSIGTRVSFILHENANL